MHLKRRRIEYSGAIYHVTQRGNNHETIFKDVIDKNYYLKLLRLYKEKCDFKLLGYSIMDNHYHLLLKTEATPLNKIMHRIGTKYSRYYNMKNERTGHVFSDRYAAGLIQDEKYLFSALRYIHWNAVRAGICANASEYPWSSDHAYRSNDRNMVDIDFILNSFSQDRSNAIKTYREMMQTGKEELEDYTITPVIGKNKPCSEKAHEMINKSFVNKEIFDEIFDHKKDVKEIQRQSLEQLLNNSGATTRDIKLIKEGSRKRFLQPFKQAFARLAIEEGYTYEEIGNFIGVSGVAIHKLLKNKLMKSSLST